MPLTFDHFRNQHSPLAKQLLGDRGNRHLLEELCHATFEELSLHERGNVRSVHLKMLMIFHDRFVDDLASPTGRVMRILDRKFEIDPTRSWPPFTQFLDEGLKPALLRMSLLRRLNAALHLLEWGEKHAPNVPIANLFEPTFAAIEPTSLRHLPTPEACRVLTILRDTLCKEVAQTCKHQAFLRQLIRHSDDMALEAEAIADLRMLVNRKPEARFARDQDPTDRYGWLRERWNEARQVILRTLDLTRLTVRTRQDKHKPRVQHGE